MLPEISSLEIEVLDSILKIPEVEWNALEAKDFIFGDHRFLSVLEESGSLGRRTGWYPRYLTAREKATGVLLGALPLFLKTNSYGEYIFDWAWANAAELAGDTYYPKLVSAIPFTPATGPKFLFKRGGADVSGPLLRAAEALVEGLKSRSLHFLFVTPAEASSLRQAGYLIRHSFQYHWRNEGWASFEDFLASLRSKRRSEIRRERAGANALGLTIETFTGDALNAESAKTMATLYRAQTGKMGGASYLTPQFFELAVEKLKGQMVFITAAHQGQVVAGALNFTKGKTLFGRYWGSIAEYKYLHFELCYYRAIDWALANGIELFEAGAQGEHKFNRGFQPTLTLSAHRLENEDLARAVESFLEEEKAGLQALFRDYEDHDPYNRSPEASGRSNRRNTDEF